MLRLDGTSKVKALYKSLLKEAFKRLINVKGRIS